MKILYAAMYNDPRDSDAASGVDYNFYRISVVSQRMWLSLDHIGCKVHYLSAFFKNYMFGKQTTLHEMEPARSLSCQPGCK